MKILDIPRSGSYAGTTSSHNRAGQYVRNRRSPVQPIGNGRRAFIRGAFSASSAGWEALTDAQRAAFDSYASAHPITDSLGQTITLTGHQMYVSIATQLQNVGGTLPTVPPTTTAQDAIVPVTASINTTGTPAYLVNWTPGDPANFVLVAASKPMPAGRSFNKTFCQLIVMGADAGSIDVKTQYNAQFGVPPIGSRVFVKVTPVNADGVTGGAVISSAIVT